MQDLIKAFHGLVKPRSINIDNIFFCLHYKLTVIFLLALSLLVASQQFFGKPIHCEFEEYKNGELNNYCFVEATFVRDQIAGHAELGEEHTENNQVRYCSYYPWVFFALFLQAVFFYIPHNMWKAWEGRRLKVLASELRSPVLDDDSVKAGAERLSKYFFKHFHTHNRYAYKYFACELFNLINIIGQIIFLNRFIGDGYQLYGLYAIFMNRGDMEKRIGKLFPMNTICKFERYSLTGRKEELEGICLLTYNSLNEKIYTILWVWTHFLAFVTALVVIYRIITLFHSGSRLYLFRLTCHRKNADEIHAVYKKLQIGDWFLLLLLHQNLNSRVYNALISRLAELPKSDVSET